MYPKRKNSKNEKNNFEIIFDYPFVRDCILVYSLSYFADISFFKTASICRTGILQSISTNGQHMENLQFPRTQQKLGRTYRWKKYKY